MKVLFSVCVLAACLSAALNVELSVKECAGVGSDGYPISTVVPLPRGEFQDISTLRLTDASGNTVPAQFEILNRRWLDDQSIANVKVYYQPVVTAFSGSGTGVSKYYLKDDGSGNSASTQLSVTDVSGVISVTTGPLKFTVKKNGFNILDQVWLDKNNDGTFSSSEEVIQSASSGGGQFIGRLDGDVQYDADRDDLLVEVEQSGPMVAIIRVEAVTKYYGPSDHTHGWAVRIYAYAGKPFIKVDYQLQNSAKTKKHSYPLYFNAMNLNFALKMGSNPSVKVGLDGETVFSQNAGKGIQLMQIRDSASRVLNLETGDTLSTGTRPNAFMNIHDGNFGVTVVTRNFWRTWPNGLSVDSVNKLQVQLFPEWSCQIHAASKTPTFNSSGLYWLMDMQHVYKEVLLNFHGSAVSDADLKKFAKTVDFHPVATMSTDWAATAAASLDFEGMIPFRNKIGTSDIRVPAALSATRLGWNWFRLNGRRTGTATAGGYPQGGGKFWATENPVDWYESEWDAIGELNVRPQSVAQYNRERDWDSLKLAVNICGSSVHGIENYAGHINWRQQSCGGDVLDSALIEGTADGSSAVRTIGAAHAIDNHHGWLYHVRDAYWITGNPWLKDWYKFLGELRKYFFSVNRTPEGINDRGNGHTIAHALHSYEITGDTSIPRMISSALQAEIRPMFRRQYGDKNGLCCGNFGEHPYEVGFFSRSIINLMHEYRNKDPQIWADCFQMIAGWADWNLNYAWYSGNAWAPGTGEKSAVSGTVLSEPMAWYYLNTGRSQHKDFLIQFITNGINGGAKDYHNMGNASYNWLGEYNGRWVQAAKATVRADSVPPQPINNLLMTRTGTQCNLTWTVPADAKRYHIVWGNWPIVETPTDNPRYLNWWAGKAVGKVLAAAAGTQDQVTFTVPDTGLIYAAVFTWDSANNMSRISNIGRSDMTPASAPTNLTVNVISAQKAVLTWGASTDAESGIWWYNVYRNGLLIASVENYLTFTDEGLSESSTYNYEVVAVSGSNVEGLRSQVVNVSTPVDTEAPTITSISSISDLPELTVHFSERVDSASAVNIANYSIGSSVSIVTASLQDDKKSVKLTCVALAFDTVYTLTINGVKDLAVTQNTATNVQKLFIHREPLHITNTRPTEYIWDIFTTDVDCFIDQGTKMTYIPQSYRNLPLLRCGSYQSKWYARNDSIIAFNSNKPLMVYIMMEIRQTARPAWLTGKFSQNGDTIYSQHNFIVWEAEYPAGRIQIPGGNLSQNYSNFFVVVRPLDSSWTSVESTESQVYNDGFFAYPNPFNPQISMAVQLSKFSGVANEMPVVKIFDMQGRLVASPSPLMGKQVRGSARFDYVWNGSGFASGTYIVSATVKGKNWRRNIILLK